MEKIAVLGGSITYGANASIPEENSWPPLLVKALEKTPGRKISLVNAGIGGTRSELGVFRLEQDVLSENPALITVEFAVNDGGNRESTGSVLESIIRKIWSHNPFARIVFIISARRSGDPAAAGVHRDIAGYYGVPVADVSANWTARVEIGEFSWDDVLLDSVHPNDRGFKEYAALVFDRISKLKKEEGRAPKEMPKRLFVENLDSARLVHPSEISDGLKWIPSPYSRWAGVRADGGPGPKDWPDPFRHGFAVIERGCGLRWKVNCSALGLYFRMDGSDTPFSISLDGEAAGEFTTGGAAGKPHWVMAGRGLSPAEHTLEIEVHESAADGGELMLGYGLVVD